MIRIYTNEQFPLPVVRTLRDLYSNSYDILTVHEAQKDNQRISDHDVLNYAKETKRAVLSLDFNDYKHLHKWYQENHYSHYGIIICKYDLDFQQLAIRIDKVIQANLPLENKLVRVYLENYYTQRKEK